LKNSNLNIRIQEQFHKKIKDLAEDMGLNQSDFVILKCLGLKPVEKRIEKTYPLRRKLKDGTVKDYTQTKVIRVTEYVPAEEVKN